MALGGDGYVDYVEDRNMGYGRALGTVQNWDSVNAALVNTSQGHLLGPVVGRLVRLVDAVRKTGAASALWLDHAPLDGHVVSDRLQSSPVHSLRAIAFLEIQSRCLPLRRP